MFLRLQVLGQLTKSSSKNLKKSTGGMKILDLSEVILFAWMLAGQCCLGMTSK
jgi:hypothetical protein